MSAIKLAIMPTIVQTILLTRMWTIMFFFKMKSIVLIIINHYSP